MVILPSPTSLFPGQLIAAPLPAGGPSKELFAFGSSFIHGDHASHFFSSFTCGKIAAGGAAIVAERETRKSDGCKATIMRKAAMTTGNAIRAVFNTVFLDIEYFAGQSVDAARRIQPPAIAPTIRNGSAPLTISSGNNVSGGSSEKSSLHTKNRMNGRRFNVT